MKYYIFTLFVFSTLSSVRSQMSEKAFYYDVVFSGDSTAVEIKGNDSMVLWTNGSYSVFQSHLAYQLDSAKSLLIKNASSSGDVNLTELMQIINNYKKPIFKYTIHKNLIGRQVDFYNEMFNNSFHYKDDLEKFQWNIKNEFKEVLGYNCQMATTNFGGRDYIAWFTEEIPLQEGPYIFNGLPGLIMEISDTRGHYKFLLTAMETKKVDMNGLRMNNAISTTKSEYTKTRRKYYSNVQLALGERAGRVDPESLKEVQERYNRANNPIELDIKQIGFQKYMI